MSTPTTPLKSTILEHKQEGATQKSYLVYDEQAPLPIGSVGGKRPGVLVVPEWWGLDHFAKSKADELARLGYVALAIDIFGEGHTTADPKEASALSTKFKANRPWLRERVHSGLEALRTSPQVEKSKIAAIGYCFGGTSVLELAKSGADVLGVTSFHGGLDAVPEPDPQPIKARFLILHGAADAFVPAENITAFLKDLDARGADWQMVSYSGAKHSFTNKEAGTRHIPGMEYSPTAATRSWKAMCAFLNEVFA